MRWGFRWATATKGSEWDRLLASDFLKWGTRPNGTPTPSYNHPPASILATAGGLTRAPSYAYLRRVLRRPLRPVLALACRSAVSLSEHGLHSWSRSVARFLHFPGLCP